MTAPSRHHANRFLDTTEAAAVAWKAGDDVRRFHRSLPGYAPTPLRSLPNLAKQLGLGAVYVKDEAGRFGLKAFKVLGASYAMFQWLKQRLHARGVAGELTPERFFHADVIEALGQVTFATATDGNHGRAVAWTAKKLGQRAVVYVPQNTVAARIEAIQSEGAEVVVVPGTYDETVKRAAQDSQANGWQVISDTAYEGYTEIPRWIMDGYGTLFEEAREQLGAHRVQATFLQAGVGGLACAGVLHRNASKLVSVEPLDADCLLESIASEDGGLREAKGRQQSIMAGLNCGTPSTLAWPVIKSSVELFLSVDDVWAREAMRRFANPLGDDPAITAGESGAAGLAGLLALCNEKALVLERIQLGLAANTGASVMLINTEGDTDPVSYREILAA